MTGIACNDMIDANLRNMVKIIILDIHASAKVAFCTRLSCFYRRIHICWCVPSYTSYDRPLHKEFITTCQVRYRPPKGEQFFPKERFPIKLFRIFYRNKRTFCRNLKSSKKS